ncbi:hypothetical protein FQA47_006367 [Oryzias melastigma]|uniref:Uncharacterized protein n=1 Tax=Oryzias melastigma TaxID=30732 RepID=A0A834CGE2_ORYME|nr:hypothetical protein FQA47_006367 [Oryzias melastigma]
MLKVLDSIRRSSLSANLRICGRTPPPSENCSAPIWFASDSIHSVVCSPMPSEPERLRPITGLMCRRVQLPDKELESSVCQGEPDEQQLLEEPVNASPSFCE